MLVSAGLEVFGILWRWYFGAELEIKGEALGKFPLTLMFLPPISPT